MKTVTDWVKQLRAIKLAEAPDYLDENSGLPGAHANLTLVEAVVRVADDLLVNELINHGGEYQMMCAAAFFGAHADNPDFKAAARRLASDDRWRVREGVAMGLQWLGDVSLLNLSGVIAEWFESGDLLVQRAAIAAMCEPRLLRTPEYAKLAIDACNKATQNLAKLSAEKGKAPAARVLRQALGYCWSVAIVADPPNGLPVFRALDTSQADIAWIVKENWRKKRLQPYSV